MRATAPFSLALCALFFSAEASGQNFFTQNRMIVVTAATGTEAVVEIDYSVVTDGGGNNTSAIIRTFGVGDLLDPWGCAFGPDGNLYVSAADPGTPANGQVVRYGPDGLQSGTPITHANLQGARGLCFGPEGHLFVCSATNGVIMEFDSDGTFLQNIGVGTTLVSPTGVVVGPNGNLFVTDPPQNTIFEFSPIAGSSPIRQFTPQDQFGNVLNLPRGLAFGPRGHLFVCNVGDNRITELDEVGNVVQEIASLLVNELTTFAIGADSNFYVPSEGSNRVIVLNGDETPTGAAFAEVASIGAALTGFNEPRAICFTPQRWGVDVRGTAYPANTAKLKKNSIFKDNVGPYLWWAPGTRYMTLTLPDNLASTTDLASVLGNDLFVFSGFQTMQDVTFKTRAFAGQMIPEPNFDTGSASIFLNIAEGKINAEGQFSPKAFIGDFHRQARNVIYDGVIVSVKLTNK